jgi:hypothetical protein
MTQTPEVNQDVRLPEHMYSLPMARVLALLVDQYLRCCETGNKEREDKSKARIEYLVSEYFPSGSGWDNGTKIQLEDCTADKIVLCGAFHHMNNDGYYVGWTEHTITVKASLAHVFDLRISGLDRNEIKDYLAEMFSDILSHSILEMDEDMARAQWIPRWRRGRPDRLTP